MTAPAATQPLVIDTGRGAIGADLRVPPAATGLVMFAHGSGSSRFSSRNRAVAAHLEHEGFATLLLDLLTTDEEAIDRVTAQHRFDIPLLAERVVAATDWLATRDDLHGLPLGYFGASTGAAAALIAAAERPVAARAVVSRGGRPDLAGSALGLVEAPTLLIIGSNDEPVIELNQAARDRMTGGAAVEMAIVPGATHLFEEPGTIEQVMALASGWFQRWLAGAA